MQNIKHKEAIFVGFNDDFLQDVIKDLYEKETSIESENFEEWRALFFCLDRSSLDFSINGQSETSCLS